MSTSVREAMCIFIDVENLKATINELLDVGFDPDEIGILAGENTVESSLGTIYSRINTYSETGNAPEAAFVHTESLGHNSRSLAGGLMFTGASTAAGATVVSAGIFGGALLAAAAGAVAVLSVGALVGALINRGDVEHLEEHVDAGHILLFVRAENGEKERLLVDILNRHHGQDVNVYEVETG